MNLDYWNKFSPETQQKILSGFKQMEDRMWELADTSNDDAINCNVGKDPCTKGTKFKMTMVPVSAADDAKIKAAVTSFGVAAVEGVLQQGRPQVHRGLERHGRQGTRLRDQDEQRSSLRVPAAP